MAALGHPYKQADGKLPACVPHQASVNQLESESELELELDESLEELELLDGTAASSIESSALAAAMPETSAMPAGAGPAEDDTPLPGVMGVAHDDSPSRGTVHL